MNIVNVVAGTAMRLSAPAPRIVKVDTKEPNPLIATAHAKAVSVSTRPVGGFQPNKELLTRMHQKDYKQLSADDHVEFNLMDTLKNFWINDTTPIGQPTPQGGMRMKAQPVANDPTVFGPGHRVN